MRNDVYQVVTDRIIALLETGTVPWRKPWKGGEPPQNLMSRKPYRGINVFLLNAARFTSPFWLSFKQVQTIGATVRKGERAFPVVFWKMLELKGDSHEIGEAQEDKAKAKPQAPFLRYYKVFNVEQCQNVKPTLLPKLESAPFQPIERCDRLVAQMPKRPKIVHGESRAAYCPIRDRVSMPNSVAFDSPEFYYSTLFHELTHASGHASRLGRKEITEPHRFGSDPYSREEMVAEMGAAFLCGYCGIGNRTLNESASYIQGWLERLRNDRKLVVLAAAQAQKACDFIRRDNLGEPEANQEPSPNGTGVCRHSENPAKRYEGMRTDYGAFVTVDGRALDPRLDLYNHSPDGFEWGYGGSGPAQLALALLADHLGDDKQARALYQQFKWSVVSGLPHGQWTLTSRDIEQALERIRQQEAASGGAM